VFGTRAEGHLSGSFGLCEIVLVADLHAIDQGLGHTASILVGRACKVSTCQVDKLASLTGFPRRAARHIGLAPELSPAVRSIAALED